MVNKYIYFFGGGKAQGSKEDKGLLGGKGANLAEMTNLGVNVPAGFTITTGVCSYYYGHERSYPEQLDGQIDEYIEKLEEVSSKQFADSKNPLLVSVRSGSPVSMPGMMDTILNLGLNEETTQTIAKEMNNETFAYDSYRRFIQMFGNVVMGIGHDKFEEILDSVKKENGAATDQDLQVFHIKEIIERYKQFYKTATSSDFPEEPRKQLRNAIDAVFRSWMTPRAVYYRKMHQIPENLGTAVNIQSMVFGNLGNESGTGVAFTRNPSTGENKFFGEFLMNAQGEDVVAGIRTPLPIEELKEILPDAYEELLEIGKKLENHYTDIQDIEFTIERKRLYLLQTRNAKRSAFAAIRSAVEMQESGLISRKTAILRIEPNALPSLLARIFNEKEKKEAIAKNKVIAEGLPAGPGAATGQIALSTEKVHEMHQKNIPSILVRTETSPEDISGMDLTQGILTERGGMTSHAAVVARGMNKPCIVGCSELEVDYTGKEVLVKSKNGNHIRLKEADWVSIDGFTGEVIQDKLKTVQSEIEQVLIEKSLPLKESLISGYYIKIMEWAKEFSRLKIRTNSDTPQESHVAVCYGAEGIGLCRTEHMFFNEKRILAMRKMILASSEQERNEAIEELLPFQKTDFKSIFKEMAGKAVTIRLLDPPLHEFLPHDDEESLNELAQALSKEKEELRKKMEHLKEFNPMLGHRGCRLGITYPEITIMQTRAILEASCELIQENIEVFPEIMVPLVGHYKELKHQSELIRQTAQKVEAQYNCKVPYLIGTMIEVPRAALTADEIALHADFFSFGTNDLTQMGMGFSRDDGQSFLPSYIQLGIYESNPFEVLDQEGIGKFIQHAVEQARKTKPDLTLGLCGEHGGEPRSIAFCHLLGLDYVSCSPYRVPIAQIAAAQAALKA